LRRIPLIFACFTVGVLHQLSPLTNGVMSGEVGPEQLHALFECGTREGQGKSMKQPKKSLHLFLGSAILVTMDGRWECLCGVYLQARARPRPSSHCMRGGMMPPVEHIPVQGSFSCRQRGQEQIIELLQPHTK
jgi:hypothetical protein